MVYAQRAPQEIVDNDLVGIEATFEQGEGDDILSQGITDSIGIRVRSGQNTKLLLPRVYMPLLFFMFNLLQLLRQVAG